VKAGSGSGWVIQFGACLRCVGAARRRTTVLWHRNRWVGRRLRELPAPATGGVAFPGRAEQIWRPRFTVATHQIWGGLAPGPLETSLEQQPSRPSSRASSAGRDFPAGPARPVVEAPCWPAVTAWRCCQPGGGQAALFQLPAPGAPGAGAGDLPLVALIAGPGEASCGGAGSRRPCCNGGRHGLAPPPAPPDRGPMACGCSTLAPERLRAEATRGCLEECWSRASLVASGRG